MADSQQVAVENGTPRTGQATLVVETWMAGYLSGIADGTGKDFLAGTDTKMLKLWMSRYCRDNPLKNTVDGSMEFAKEQMKKKGLLK